MYYELTPYERSLARFGDKCSILAGLELNNKITPEDAYQQIREMYKELKRIRKEEKPTWEKTE